MNHIGQKPLLKPPTLSERLRNTIKHTFKKDDQSSGQKEELRDPLTEGKQEAVKEDVKEEEKQKQKINDLVDVSHQILLHIKAVWPFDFFPDEIMVDINKVDVVKKYFFWSERRHSVFVKDISDVFVETSILFASLNIIDSGFAENIIQISFLKKDEAIRARKIIQGIVVAAKQGVDLSKLELQDLLVKIEELGKMKADE